MEGKNYFLKIVKLKTSQKLPDRNFVTDVYIPKNEDENKFGAMIVFVEIRSPWFPAADVGKLIYNTAVNTYYHSEKEFEDNQQRFEEALKSVNKKLAEIANRGEVEWLGNLNAICAVIEKNNFYLSHTGHAEGYLFRQKSFSHITEGAKKDETPHPLKTFTNLTAGELEPGDKILIATKELFEDIPFQDVRKSIIDNKIYNAVQIIAKLLKRKKNNKINLFIFKLSKADKPKAPNISEVILDEKRNTWLSKTAKLVQPAIDVAGGTMTEKEIAEKIEKNKNTSLTRKFFIAIGTSAIKIGGRFSANFKKKSRRELIKEKMARGDIDTKLYSEPKVTEEKKTFSEKIINIFRFIFEWIGGFFANILKPERKRFSQIIAIIIVVILLIFGISALRKSQARREAEMNAQQQLTQAQQKAKEGDEQLSLNQKNKAKTLYLESLDLAAKAAQHPKVEEEANAFAKTVQNKIDQIDKITRYGSLEPIVDFGAQNNLSPSQFFIIKKDIFTINPSTGQLDKFETSVGKIANLGTAGIVQNPLFSFFLKNDIFVYTNNKYIYKYDLDGNTRQVTSSAGNEWNGATAGSYFSGNIYLLDSDNGQIWKYRPDGDDFGSAIEYLNTTQVDIRNAKTMAIDGYVYVITKTNKLIKMLAGTVQNDFKIQDIPTPLNKIENGVNIYANSELNFIYILDAQNRRVVEIDKEGLYSQQIILPENFTDLKQIYVSQKNKKMYILNASSVYEIEL